MATLTRVIIMIMFS